MRPNSRKSQRRSFECVAWIDLDDGSPMVKCALGDISDTGAKLGVTAPKELPDRFVLRFRGADS